MPERQKSITGTVVSDKMDKTVVVLVQRTTRHRFYHKILRRSKRYLVHDDRFEAKTGDLVRITETRPLSRHKRWRLAEIIQRGEVAEIAPREIDSDYLAPQREREEPPDATAQAADAAAAAADQPPTAPEGELAATATPVEPQEEPATPAEAEPEAAEEAAEPAPEDPEEQ